MANSREEQLRSNRRLSRQMLGAVALVLVLIGLFTVIGWLVGGLRSALDDSERKESYADRLYGLVMFDVVPFETVADVDSSVFRQAAIWGSLYQLQKTDSTLEGYERDADTGSLILPKLLVDTYLSNLLGPDYALQDGNFETPEFVYTYDEEKQGYYVPVTGSVGLYTPEVEKISTRSGKTYVTVGYIPTNNTGNGELTLTAPTTPTKYMDYVFERGENRKWYLSALQESTMQPEATATPVPTAAAEQTDPQALVESNLDTLPADSETAVTEEPAPAEGTEEVPADAAPAEEMPVEQEPPADAPAEETPAESEAAPQ